MTLLLSIAVLFLSILVWGAWSRLHDLEIKFFEREHPEFFKDDGVIAEYLGTAQDD